MWLKGLFAMPQWGSLTNRSGWSALRSAAKTSLYLGFLLILPLSMSGCAPADTPATQNAAPKSCSTLTGSPWVPSVPGVSNSNHSGSVTLTKTVLTGSGRVIGLGQSFTTADEVSVSIDMTQDLGSQGSLMLMGMVTDFPSALSGGAFPYLVSLDDGTNNYINLSGNCLTNGLYTCSSGVCNINTGCTLDPGAYPSRTEWELRQGQSSGVNSPSVNIFPTCNWTGGSVGSSANPVCPFVTTVAPATSPFFPGGTGRLRHGVNYTAKYLILADSYSTVTTSRSANVQVTAIKKNSSVAPGSGAMDINVILVGNTNVQASRTSKGQQNLNTLMSVVAGYYSQSGTGVKIGQINSIEYDCLSGGDDFAALPVDQLGALLTKSGSLVPSANETRALNLFLVSSIENNDPTSNLTILGIDGSIGGPLMNGTAFSGMAMSTFDALDQYNPNCFSSTPICPSNKQDSSFFQLTDTAAHEMGHYFGLQHVSEAAGTAHDYLPDTPVCTRKASNGYLTVSSCRLDNTNTFLPTSTTCNADCTPYNASAGTFCANKASCEFNYIMWWTSKNFDSVSGLSDGSMFSTSEGSIINYHPLVQ
jgi:hypothetical protein